MKRFLSISALFILFSCSAPRQSLVAVSADYTCLKKFKPVFKADLYSASIDVIGKHLSGLLLFKTMHDSSLRLVFTNEIGVEFFDFEFSHGGFKLIHVIPQLNKRPVIKTLRKDFELMTMNWVSQEPAMYESGENNLFAYKNGTETDYIITTKDCATLLRLEKTARGKKKSEVRLFGRYDSAPDSIVLSHTTFRLDMRLKHLDRN